MKRLSPVVNSGFRTRVSGFTLVELVVSMAITSVLMLGMGSAILIASRAMPGAASAAGAMIGSSQALEQVITELQYATAVTERSVTTIEFSVADRDGDAMDETVRYAWSGTPGAPITRQYNGGVAVEVLTDVREFALSYVLDAVSTEMPQGNESAETVLKAYWSSGDEGGEDLAGYSVTQTDWYAQYFMPSLPSDAVSWRVTRAQLSMRSYGDTEGQGRVQLQLATAGGFLSGVAVEEKTLLESTLLSSYTTTEFTFSNVTGLSPDQGLCLLIEWVANGTICSIIGQSNSAYPSDSMLLRSVDQGVSWSVCSGQSLWFRIYGTVTTAGEPQILNTYYLDRVRVSLRAGDDPQATVQSAVRLLNRPEVMQ